ncbi:MAG: precorrin-6A/cobalt-precorrin-6A reductase [Pseudomonadota bacterium]
MSAKVLVLAGTAEARALCALIAQDGRVEAIASLAGATSAPAAYPVRTRIGGFGGVSGLADWIAWHGIAAIVDATHPFATTIQAHAEEAAQRTSTPLLRFDRPAWIPEPGDRWTPYDGLPALLDALPTGARVFAALGSRAGPHLAKRPDVWFLLRAVEAAPGQAPNTTMVRSLPEGNDAAERAIMIKHRITHLVTRNAGGAAGTGKLRAARDLGLPVLMLARPRRRGAAPSVPSPTDALAWLIGIVVAIDALSPGRTPGP